MFLPNVCLRELAHSAPVCSDAVTVLALLDAFNQCESDHLILLDASSYPVGTVRLHRLLADLMTLEDELSNVSGVPKGDNSASYPKNAASHALLKGLNPRVIDSIAVLPGEWTLQQFFTHWRAHTHPEDGLVTPPLTNQALVDREGKFLGVLDPTNLLEAIADQLMKTDSQPLTGLVNPSAIALSPPGFATVPDGDDPAIAPQIQQRQIIQLTQQLLAQRAELEQRIRAQQDEIKQLRTHQTAPQPLPSLAGASQVNAQLSDGSSLQPFLELLERLPLPLMLQTRSGRIVAQNSVWRQQIGALLDPAVVQRDAAVLLEQPIDEKHAPYPGQFTQHEPLEDRNFSAAEPGICHLGPTPDTCICVCPLKDGHEQIVQFVKIPFGMLLPDYHLTWSSTQCTNGDAPEVDSSAIAETADSFHLAPLTSASEASCTEGFTKELSSQGNSPRGAAIAQTSRPSTTDATLSRPSPESLWLVLAQDVTEQQQLARELTAKNADLVQLNRLKDEFLACISHELKTPLTAVLGLSSLLKDQTLGTLNQRQVHYAQLIHQSSRHLMGVVNDILDLTRIETGQLELLYEPITVATICARAFDQAKQARLSEIRTDNDLREEHLIAQFSLDIEPGLEFLVADDLRLRQMLVHLLSNALKFTEIDKPIGLKVNRWGGWIAFTVWDTGIGISPEKQHLIFQKFQQLENPLTRRFEGAGLGLVLTRRLARLHGGDVTFISKEGEGSQFTILLPPTPPDLTKLTRGSDEDGNVSANTRTAGYPGGRVPLHSSSEGFSDEFLGSPAISLPVSRSRLILIVEAVPQSIERLTDKLTGLGYRVVIARSGTEALEKARRLQPCMVFLNPLLPLLSGWDVLTLLKSNATTRHIPVVITATTADEDQAYRSSANGFLSLPIQTKLLQQTLQQGLIAAAEPDPRHLPPSGLTVLRLRWGIAESGMSSINPQGNPPEGLADLNRLLQLRQYRVVESDDLDQAELLARVWKPNVLLIDGSIPDPKTYLHQLSCHTFLASLPIVTLDAETTQVANQIPGLLVFPCLLPVEVATTTETLDLSTLLQVIQVAAGFVWRPSIVAVDLSALPFSVEGVDSLSLPREDLGDFPKESEWLQALMQYLQTAGFRGMIGRSWQEVFQQVQTQSVDLLLICWTSAEVESSVLEVLSTLAQLESRPPVIVLDHRSHEAGDRATTTPLPDVIHQLASLVVSPPISITELLAQIHQVIPS